MANITWAMLCHLTKIWKYSPGEKTFSQHVCHLKPWYLHQSNQTWPSKSNPIPVTDDFSANTLVMKSLWTESSCFWQCSYIYLTKSSQCLMLSFHPKCISGIKLCGCASLRIIFVPRNPSEEQVWMRSMPRRHGLCEHLNIERFFFFLSNAEGQFVVCNDFQR